MQPTGQQPHRLRHPLEPLTEDEVRDAAAAVRAHPEYADGSVFIYITLREPAKAAVAEYELAGRVPDRQGKVVLYDRSQRLVSEVVVSLADGKVRSWLPVPGARPKASRRDFLAAVEAGEGRSPLAGGDAEPGGHRLHPC